MINLGLQTKMIGKMINFYKNNNNYIEDIVRLKKDNTELKDDIFDENCNIEYNIDKVLWSNNEENRNNYLALMKLNYNGLQDKI